MKLNQMTARYEPEQDRILLRINTHDQEELRVWFTRRVCLTLWPRVQQVVTDRVAQAAARDPARRAAATADEQTRQMLADFHREQSLASADLRTPFRTDARQFPLGNDPLLLTEIGLSNRPDGRLRVELVERLPGQAQPRSFRMNLEDGNLQGLMHLLDQALKKSGWLGDAPAPEAAAPAAPDPQRPRFLN